MIKAGEIFAEKWRLSNTQYRELDEALKIAERAGYIEGKAETVSNMRMMYRSPGIPCGVHD